MKNLRVQKLRIAKPISVSRGNSTDLYGNGIKNMLAVMQRKENREVREKFFKVYSRENWLI